MSNDEIFPIVDDNGNVVGSATRRDCHGGSMKLHPVVHLHILAPGGYLYLQKRVDTKDIQPGKWDTAVGGHVDYGESIAEALARESTEELGHRPVNHRHLISYIFQSEREREFVNVFTETLAIDTPLYPDPNEIAMGKFWHYTEIEDSLHQGIFTPNFEMEYRKIKLDQLLRSN